MIKFHYAPAEVETKAVKSYYGAYVGDKIIWSSHHPSNGDLPEYLTTNKLYEVIAINAYGDAIVTCDEGGRSSWNKGRYDVIVRGNTVEPEPVFGKAVLEIDDIKSLRLLVDVLGNQKEGEYQTHGEWKSMKEVAEQFR